MYATAFDPEAHLLLIGDTSDRDYVAEMRDLAEHDGRRRPPAHHGQDQPTSELVRATGPRALRIAQRARGLRRAAPRGDGRRAARRRLSGRVPSPRRWAAPASCSTTRTPVRGAALASVVARRRGPARAAGRPPAPSASAQIEAFDVDAALRVGRSTRPRTGKRPLQVQVQGPFETSYSLAVAEPPPRASAGSTSRGLDVSIYATEGPGDYTPRSGRTCASTRRRRRSTRSRRGPCSRRRHPPDVPTSGRTTLPAASRCQYFGWEESRLPRSTSSAFNRAPGRHRHDVAVRAPTCCVDSGVDGADRGDGRRGRAATTPPPCRAQPEVRDLRSTVFLHIGSALPRKGVDVLLRAYFDRFTGADDVTLV